MRRAVDSFCILRCRSISRPSNLALRSASMVSLPHARCVSTNLVNGTSSASDQLCNCASNTSASCAALSRDCSATTRSWQALPKRLSWSRHCRCNLSSSAVSVLAPMASSLNAAGAAVASHALKSALAARDAAAFHSMLESSRSAAAITAIGKSALGALVEATVAQRAVATALTLASASVMAALNVATLTLFASAAVRTRTSASVVARV